LERLNAYLAHNSYIEGYGPTQNDVKIYRVVPNSVDCAVFPHVKRWANHIAAFTPQVRSRWSKGKVTLDDKEEKKASPQEKKTSKKGSDKPAKKGLETPEKKSSEKNKKNKKGKKQKEREIESEPIAEEPVEEEPAAEEPVNEEVVEESAPEEAATEEEAVPEEEAANEEEPAAEEEPEDENLSFDDLGLDDDEDDEETRKLLSSKKELVEGIQARQAANATKAKSNLTLDVKPFDTETDMLALEQKIRKIEMEGLKWLGGTLLDVAYGIKKLRIMCQLVDMLVNPDSVREEIEKFEDEVQSTDVFAFQMA